MRYTVIATMVLVVVLGLAGCNIMGPALYLIHGPAKTKAEYTLDRKRPTVVFVDDRLNRVPRRASRVLIGEQAEKSLLKAKAVADMISSQSALQAVGRDKDGVPTPITEIGKAVNAEVVIYAVLDEFALTRDGQTFSPGAAIRVKVVEVATGKRLWPTNPAGHPVVVRVNAKQGSIPDSTASRYSAEDELARQCGQEIAWLFFKHETAQGLKTPE